MDYATNADYYDCQKRDLIPSGVQYTVITDLAAEPVTLEFFKLHGRIDYEMDDSLCEAYITAARMELEEWAQLSFGVKTIGLTALSLPKNYKLMYGKVDTILTDGFTNVGDILKEGGRDIDIEFTTKDWVTDLIRISVCRYAAGLYIFRENILETKFSADVLKDQAKLMLQPIRNITQW